MTARDKNRPPIHPGEILREDVLPGLHMSITDAAAEMHVTRHALHRVLAGTAAVSPEMALRIGKFCGNGGDVWLRMQAAYDLWHAERKLAGEIATIKTQRARAA
jgi:addiction module HigA family antidote